jgi:hypothetical protein
MRELVPGAARIAVLVNPTNAVNPEAVPTPVTVVPRPGTASPHAGVAQEWGYRRPSG